MDYPTALRKTEVRSCPDPGRHNPQRATTAAARNTREWCKGEMVGRERLEFFVVIIISKTYVTFCNRISTFRTDRLT